MKICFVLGTLQYSGAEKIVRYLINELQKDKYEISVILLSCEKKYDDLKGINQIPLYKKDEEKGNKFIRVKKRIKRIRKVIQENHFDLVVSFGVKFNLDVVDAIKRTKTKLILCERNDPSHDPKSNLLRIRRKLIYNRADGFVFQTKKIQSFFSKEIQKKSIIIPNFIEKHPTNIETYNPIKKTFATSARLDIRQKDQVTLIKAFEMFNKIYPEYKLEIYGDGADRKVLEELSAKLNLKDKIIFYGRVDNPIEKIKNSEAFILTSIYEGMPNSLMEAMSIGMPCISTKCGGGGPQQLIQDKENGILVEIGNKQQIVDAMIKICEDKSYAQNLGRNAYKINEQLNIEKIVKIWKQYFKQVAMKD